MYYYNYILGVGYRCDKKGCGSVLVFDGNMKNHRDVCFASNAGVAFFSGLPGQVRVGCQDTPSFKSRYCLAHTPTAASSQGPKNEKQIGFIVGKRSTRTSIMYEVSVKQHVEMNVLSTV